MQPIPCAHCGYNFMRQTRDPEAPKLCNSCVLKEEKRSPTKKESMKTIEIVIKCPVEIQADIEEYCINKGMDFSKYFLSLHHFFSEHSEGVKDYKEQLEKETQAFIDSNPRGKPDLVVSKKELEEKSKPIKAKEKKK